ncbi:GNAT family N-acetyltransferase [Bacillus haynesii]|uniref:GNAT family N-acetyltransferase n=1 Tax=Bacillus haynesii TaxID=1925021 RepID=UPI002280425D|nr:hypothetical protein [Bacillus haynesii]MCY8372291.1 hypothetical protein [Bacillus haynesii]
MKIRAFGCPETFLAHTEADLLKNEAVNGLPLGILYALRRNNGSANVLLTAENENGLQMIASGDLILAGKGDLLDAAKLTAAYLEEAGIHIPGVVGHPRAAAAFVSAWKRTAKVKMRQKIYKLEKVDPVRKSSGRLRLANDAAMISNWICSFSKEAILETMERSQAEQKALRGIESSSIYVWEDGGEPVYMAQKARPTKNGITVNLVFTPRHFRRKGYASSCVAVHSQAVLAVLDDGYAFCCLYTDLSNPASNRIYQAIGYRPVADSIAYAFHEKQPNRSL